MGLLPACCVFRPMPLVIFGLTLAWLVMFLFGSGALDRGFMLALHGRGWPHLVEPAQWLTQLGSWRVLLPLTLAGAIWLLIRRELRQAALLLALCLGGRWLVEMQKDMIGRPRPDSEHLIAVTSLSFPSGHAANSAIVYISLALLLATRQPWRNIALWLAVWLSLAIGLSRAVLGVHWLSDIVGGWAFALAWTLGLLLLARQPVTDEGPPPVSKPTA